MTGTKKMIQNQYISAWRRWTSTSIHTVKPVTRRDRTPCPTNNSVIRFMREAPAGEEKPNRIDYSSIHCPERASVHQDCSRAGRLEMGSRLAKLLGDEAVD